MKILSWECVAASVVLAYTMRKPKARGQMDRTKVLAFFLALLAGVLFVFFLIRSSSADRELDLQNQKQSLTQSQVQEIGTKYLGFSHFIQPFLTSDHFLRSRQLPSQADVERAFGIPDFIREGDYYKEIIYFADMSGEKVDLELNDAPKTIPDKKVVAAFKFGIHEDAKLLQVYLFRYRGGCESISDRYFRDDPISDCGFSMDKGVEVRQ